MCWIKAVPFLTTKVIVILLILNGCSSVEQYELSTFEWYEISDPKVSGGEVGFFRITQRGDGKDKDAPLVYDWIVYSCKSSSFELSNDCINYGQRTKYDLNGISFGMFYLQFAQSDVCCNIDTSRSSNSNVELTKTGITGNLTSLEGYLIGKNK